MSNKINAPTLIVDGAKPIRGDWFLVRVIGQCGRYPITFKKATSNAAILIEDFNWTEHYTSNYTDDLPETGAPEVAISFSLPRDRSVATCDVWLAFKRHKSQRTVSICLHTGNSFFAERYKIKLETNMDAD